MTRRLLSALARFLLSLLRALTRLPAGALALRGANARRLAGPEVQLAPAGGAQDGGATETPEQFKNRNDWLRTAYTEAWKQYSHEDTLTLQRNNIFVIIQTGLLAALGSLTTALIKSETVVVGSYTIFPGYFFIGIVACVFSIFALVILRNWEGVTDSAQAYVDLRWSTCRRIEEVVGLESQGVNLAEKEFRLKKAIESVDEGNYAPYWQNSDCPSLAEFTIATRGTMGWGSIKKLIKHLRIFWCVLFCFGFTFMVVAGFLTFESPNKTPPQQLTISGPATVNVITAPPAPAVTASPDAQPSPALKPDAEAGPPPQPRATTRKR